MGKNKFRKLSSNINLLIAVAFMAIIMVGTLLLMLPISSRSNEGCGLLTALFTATSSSCVTGLVLADTYSKWSAFGQLVIILLIQIGGLGFMSITSIMIFMLNKKVSIHQRMIMAQSMGVDELGGIVRIQKKILIFCFATEFVGALLLAFRFYPTFGLWPAIRLGLFHSISAFCNAGFDIFGFIEPNASLAYFVNDYYVNFVLSALIVIGGLGFLVINELTSSKKIKDWSIYTRLVLIVSFALIFGGFVLVLVCEWNNPLTIGNMPLNEKLIAAFFQSVTTRTAGFATIDQGLFTDAGKAVSIFLMLIGGSSGSTAGGLKTVTFFVIVLYIFTKATGKEEASVFKRTIKHSDVLNAITLCGLMIGFSYFGAIIITATSPLSFTDALYETVSAIATVGLTSGGTANLSFIGKIVIIIYMYFGRVGMMTIALGFVRRNGTENKIKNAYTNVLIG